MTDTGTKAHNASTELGGTLSRLLAELAPLQEAWKGQASGSFHSVKDRYEQDMRKLTAALESLATALGASNQTYSTTDADLQSDMTSAGAQAGNITAKLQLL